MRDNKWGASKNTYTLLDACNQHRNERPDPFWPSVMHPYRVKTAVHSTVHGYPKHNSQLLSSYDKLHFLALCYKLTSTRPYVIVLEHVQILILLNSPSLIVYPCLTSTIYRRSLTVCRRVTSRKAASTFQSGQVLHLLMNRLPSSSKSRYVQNSLCQRDHAQEPDQTRTVTISYASQCPLSHDAWERHTKFNYRNL